MSQTLKISVLLLSTFVILCGALPEGRGKRSSFPLQLVDSCRSFTMTTYVNGIYDYWNLYYYITNTTAGTTCNAQNLLNAIRGLSFFTYREALIYSSSFSTFSAYYQTLCSSACFPAVRSFIKACIPYYDSLNVIDFINGMCSVNSDKVACYNVTYFIQQNVCLYPGICYGNVQLQGTKDQCSHQCRYNLLRFSLDAGCCAQSEYNTEYLRYLYYMDSNIWNVCGVNQPSEMCTLSTGDSFALSGDSTTNSINAVLLTAANIASVLITNVWYR